MLEDDSPTALMPNISAHNVPPDKANLDEYLATIEAQAAGKMVMTPGISSLAGRRTGLVIQSTVPKDDDGFDDIDSFWDAADDDDGKENQLKRHQTPASSSESSTPFISPAALELGNTPVAPTTNQRGRPRESSMASIGSLPLSGTPSLPLDDEDAEASQVAGGDVPTAPNTKKTSTNQQAITPAPKPVDPHALFTTDQEPIGDTPAAPNAIRRLDFLKKRQEQQQKEEEEKTKEEQTQEERKKPEKESSSKKGGKGGQPSVGEEKKQAAGADDSRRFSYDDDDWGIDGGDPDDYFVDDNQVSTSKEKKSGDTVRPTPSGKEEEGEDDDDEDDEVLRKRRPSTGRKQRRILEEEKEEEEEEDEQEEKTKKPQRKPSSPGGGSRGQEKEHKRLSQASSGKLKKTDEEEEDDDKKAASRVKKNKRAAAEGPEEEEDSKKRKKEPKEKKPAAAKATGKKKNGAGSKSSKPPSKNDRDTSYVDDETIMSLSDASDGDTSVGEYNEDDGHMRGDRTTERHQGPRATTRVMRMSDVYQRPDNDEDEADQVRRSGRRRMKPLKYWKNERLVVRLDDDHKIKVEEVILANPTPKPNRKRPATQKHRKKQRRRKGHDGDDDGDEEEEEEEHEAFDPSTLNPKYVYKDGDRAYVWNEDEATFGDIRVVSFRKKQREMPLPTTGPREGSRDAPLASQSFSRPPHGEGCPGWMSGYVRLPPGAVKEAEGVGLCSQVFFVMESEANACEVAYARADETSFSAKTAQRFLLSKGDHFFIPPNNVYRLENHSTHKEVVVNWVVIKPWEVAVDGSGEEAEEEEEEEAK